MRFVDWLNEHYEFPDCERARCRRCGASVGYVTKHAAERHGDSVEVLPLASTASPETVALW